MDCSWFCASAFGLFVVYKLLDRILRIPHIGRYADRYVLVTGANSGLGFDLVKRLDSLGCHVFAGCRSEKAETELTKACSGRVLPVHLDVSKSDSVQRTLRIITDTLASNGNKGLWAVVNNAGALALGAVGSIKWLRSDDYRRMTFLSLVKRSRGRVVIMSSYVGRLVLPVVNTYCVSKYGLEAFSDGLRRSLRPYGCKVCVVELGLYRTNITSVETVQACCDDSWKRATPEIRQEFGEEFYRLQRQQLSEGMNKYVEPLRCYRRLRALAVRSLSTRSLRRRKRREVLRCLGVVAGMVFGLVHREVLLASPATRSWTTTRLLARQLN